MNARDLLVVVADTVAPESDDSFSIGSIRFDVDVRRSMAVRIGNDLVAKTNDDAFHFETLVVVIVVVFFFDLDLTFDIFFEFRENSGEFNIVFVEIFFFDAK